MAFKRQKYNVESGDGDDSGLQVKLPPEEIIKIQIINHRDYILKMFADYNTEVFSGISSPRIFQLKANLLALYLRLSSSLKRNLTKEQRKILLDNIQSTNPDNITTAVIMLEQHMDRMGLTRIDEKRPIDNSMVENENEAKGL